LEALGADPASTTGINDFAVERRAAAAVFGWDGLPNYEIQDATYVLGIGADFLGGWVSPVYYARRFGHMRRGRPGLRGRLVQAESRFSQTAWSADQWLPVKPGGEQALALAIGYLLVAEKLAPGLDSAPGDLRNAYGSVDFERAIALTGLEARAVRRVAEELASSAAPLVVAGASIVRLNSFDAVVAASALNLLLGNVGKKGGVSPPAPALPSLAASRPQTRDLLARIEGANLVFLDGTDPLYVQPACEAALARVPTVISFSSFVDDSSAFADWILPGPSPMEAGEVVVPAVSPGASVTGSRAFVEPLYETRPTEQVLSDLVKAAAATQESVFKETFADREAGDADWSGGDEFAAYAQRQGGWWKEPESVATAAKAPEVKLAALRELEFDGEPEFEGSPEEYPLVLQAYPAVQFGDGSGANLPWLQQLPDPTSSAMWSFPVELDPKTAADLGVANGDLVRVQAPNGALEAPVYVHPAAIPGVVSMAIGQGHGHFGRYASGRGANPLSIVAAVFDRETGAPAFGATRVRVEKLAGQGKFVQFAPVDREPHPERH
jgi:anaerobic selenocysteine-containing dehydrogenase